MTQFYILTENCTEIEKKKENARIQTSTTNQLPEKVWYDFRSNVLQNKLNIPLTATENREFTNVQLFQTFEDALNQTNPLAEIQMTQSISDLHENLTDKCLYFYNQRAGA